MRPLSFALGVLAAVLLSGADRRLIFPPGAKPVGPYSPGILAGDFLYVSGQGALRPDGASPATAEGQVRQTLENVRAIIEAAGLTMEHIVYCQVYLVDLPTLEALERVWREYFSQAPPARAILGVARLPVETRVEITVVALRDLTRRRTIVPPGWPAGAPSSPGVMAGERLYLSGVFGLDRASGRVPVDPAEQAQLALDQMGQILRAAGLDFRHVVFVNPYLTASMPVEVMNRVYAQHFEFGNTPARATFRVAGLPQGAQVEFTGVAIADLGKRRAVRPKNMAPSPTASPCVWADDTLYCSSKAGFIPGPHSGIYASTIEPQLRQTMRNLLDGFEEAGLDFSRVVASNVYLDSIDDFARMNRIYAQYFTGPPPTRTTIQPAPSVERKPGAEDRWPALEQVSVIAVR
jgi:reactive intermediate/imine deaminase